MSKSIIINEQQALACILQKPELLKDNTKNWFVDNISRCIFDSLVKLYSNSVSFTTSTIVSECAKTEKDITHQLIEDLKTKVTYNIDDYDYYCRRLREDYVKNDLQSRVLKVATSELIKKGELNIEALQQTIDDLEKAIDIVKQKDIRLQGFPELLEKYEYELQHRDQSDNFTSSGNRFLDQHLYGGGLEYGQITTLFGNPGNGKSIAALNLVNGKINRQDPTLYIPTEMGWASTMDRLIAIRTNIPINDFSRVDSETHQISEYAIEEFKREKDRLSKLKYFKLVDESNLNKQDLRSLILSMKQELNVKHITVFIDLASMMEEFSGDNKASRWEDAINDMFKLAKEGKDAFVLIFQSRRPETVQVQNYEDCKKFEPKLEMLKNSGSIEERSRIIISIFRQKHYGIRLLGDSDPEVAIADDVLKMKIVKQNNGPLADIPYLYDGPTAKLNYIPEVTNE